MEVRFLSCRVSEGLPSGWPRKAACLIACCFMLVSLAIGSTRPRLVVLTDFYKDPDDKQSLIRLLTYGNEFDIEGIIATSLAFGDGSVRPELVHEVLAEYAKVLPSLRRHERKDSAYPSADAIGRVVKAGAPVVRRLVGPNKGFPVPYPPGARDSRTCDPPEKWVGPGKDTPASRHIIETVDRDDPRPVWITVWGGAIDLAQALWKVRSERPAVEVRRFVSKLRVYQISWQDTGAVWIWNEFPDLFLIQSADANRGIYAEGKPSLRGQAWVAENILQFGPLGAAYPKANIPGVKEGDTASFLHLLAPGLADPEQPGQGGWGGRFRQLDRSRRQWVAAEDDHPESVDPLRRKQWTVGRWNEAIALDFAARMRWCVHSFRDANHVPVAAIDGDATPRIIRRTILSGERVSLDASRSRDPDGDALRYSWSQYVEAGSFRDGVAITGAGTPNAELTAPSVRRPETIHIILSVSDGGTPMLTAYRRIIFTILPREDKSEATRTASTDVSLARRPHR